MKIIKNYKEDSKLRNSSSELMKQVFGFDFEKLYIEGFWPDKMNVYSIYEDERIVSSVYFHKYEVYKDKKNYSAIQIGGVSTYEAYRNRGFSRILMEEVLKDNEEVDLIYLYANDSVLDYYPKFGFIPTKHILFKHENINDFEILENTSRKLSIENDLELIYRCLKARIKNSKDMYIYGDDYIKMFYILYVYSDNIYYHENEDAIIICTKDGNILEVHDIFLKSISDIKSILAMHLEGVTSIEYGFEIDLDNILPYEYKDSGIFIKSKYDIFLNDWKAPTTSTT